MNILTSLLRLGTSLFFLLLAFIGGVFFEKKNHVKVDAIIGVAQDDIAKLKAEVASLKSAATAVKAAV